MRVFSPSTQSTTTSPPLPPSPPSGPPNSMNFSRRNETHPAPPSPERMWTLASSRNFMGAVYHIRAALVTPPPWEEVGRALIVTHLLLPLAGEGCPCPARIDR